MNSQISTTTAKYRQFPVIIKIPQATSTDATPNFFNFDIPDDIVTTTAIDQCPPNNCNQNDFYQMILEEVIQYDEEQYTVEDEQNYHCHEEIDTPETPMKPKVRVNY